MQDKSNKQIYFSWQVLEYHPEPWNQWVTVGNILVARVGHTVLSIGPQQLPCASGDDKNPTTTKTILVCLLVSFFFIGQGSFKPESSEILDDNAAIALIP